MQTKEFTEVTAITMAGFNVEKDKKKIRFLPQGTNVTLRTHKLLFVCFVLFCFVVFYSHSIVIQGKFSHVSQVIDIMLIPNNKR